jgi:hypothetical protein
MTAKLTELYYLLHGKAITGQLIQSQRITELITELLDTFGLPQHQGYKVILLDFCKSEPLSDDLINATLIKLADEGAFYQIILG